MKNRFRWILFFLICLGIGFLHGTLPRGITDRSFFSPTKIEILATDEIFLPEKLRQKIEQEFNVKLSFTVTRHWNSISAQLVSSPSVDLIFLPSYWANTLARQGLLSDISGKRKSIRKKVAADFINTANSTNTSIGTTEFTFLPFFWMKTKIQTLNNQSFIDFLKNKNEPFLFLLADEDLLLKHFQIWKEQNLWDLVAQKKILTLQLDQLGRETPKEGAMEVSAGSDTELLDSPLISALLVWGAAVPANSSNKALALDILDALSAAEVQEQILLHTPFNTAFSAVKSDFIPLHRRADYIRNIQLKDTLILDTKDRDAKIKLKDEFNFIL